MTALHAERRERSPWQDPASRWQPPPPESKPVSTEWDLLVSAILIGASLALLAWVLLSVFRELQ